MARLSLLLQSEFGLGRADKTGERSFFTWRNHAKVELLEHQQSPVVYACLCSTEGFLLIKGFVGVNRGVRKDYRKLSGCC